MQGYSCINILTELIPRVSDSSNLAFETVKSYSLFIFKYGKRKGIYLAKNITLLEDP